MIWIFLNFVDEKIDDPVDLQMGIDQAASKAVPARPPLCKNRSEPGVGGRAVPGSSFGPILGSGISPIPEPRIGPIPEPRIGPIPEPRISPIPEPRIGSILGPESGRNLVQEPAGFWFRMWQAVPKGFGILVGRQVAVVRKSFVNELKKRRLAAHFCSRKIPEAVRRKLGKL